MRRNMLWKRIGDGDEGGDPQPDDNPDGWVELLPVHMYKPSAEPDFDPDALDLGITFATTTPPDHWQATFNGDVVRTNVADSGGYFFLTLSEIFGEEYPWDGVNGVEVAICADAASPDNNDFDIYFGICEEGAVPVGPLGTGYAPYAIWLFGDVLNNWAGGGAQPFAGNNSNGAAPNGNLQGKFLPFAPPSPDKPCATVLKAVDATTDWWMVNRADVGWYPINADEVRPFVSFTSRVSDSSVVVTNAFRLFIRPIKWGDTPLGIEMGEL